MKNKKMWISIILAISIFAFILLLDLLTKGLIIPNLIPNVGDRVEVIPKLFSFIYVKNYGAAWGILGGRNIFLIVISIVILTLFIAFYVLRVKKVKNKSSCLLGISLGLIAGGCIGNLFDRLVFGYVRDFINFDFMDFPVFNFADIALTFGIIIMVIYFIFFYMKEEKDKILPEKAENNQKIEENSQKIVENNEISISSSEEEDERWNNCW